MAKRAAAYCRVSTEKSDQLNSLSAQQEYFREHTKQHGYELVKIYADEGITGTKKRNRKEFQKMLVDAKRGRFDVLFVKDVSRFARNTVDSLESVRMLKDYNVDIVFVNNQGILETSSELMFTIMSAMAQEESVSMSKRVKFGKRQNAYKGRVPNIVYGYDKVPGEYFSLKINAEEADTVRRIYRLYTEEGEGSLAIAKLLNSEGKRTKRGCLWSQNAIGRILRNKIYIGQLVNGREATKEIYSCKREKIPEEEWIVVPNEDLRLISDETYYTAQRILDGRYDTFHITKERHSNKYLFSTLIKCKHCKRSFRRIDRQFTYSKYIRWVCSSRNGDGNLACHNETKIKEDELLEEIIKYLEQWISNKETIMENVYRHYMIQQEEGNGDNSTQKLQEELRRYKNKQKKLQDMFMNDIISMEELKEKSTPIKKVIQDLEEQLRLVENIDYSEAEIRKQIENLFSDVRKVLNEDTITNTMLKQIIQKIEVDDTGKVEVFLRKIGDV